MISPAILTALRNVIAESGIESELQCQNAIEVRWLHYVGLGVARNRGSVSQICSHRICARLRLQFLARLDTKVDP